MNSQIDYPKLLEVLKNMELLLPSLRPDKALLEIKNLDARVFDELLRECRSFQESVERAVEDCQAAVESPIYIGVVGHFSHGKSSLLNALLFPPRTTEVLPTGEGVVTSMCTLLQFSKSTDDHEFYEVDHNGEEKFLLTEEYRARVAGRGPGRAGTTSHFKVRLDIDKLSDPLFGEFAQKQIELLDTPGLGGPYWKDQAALHAWMKEFVLVLVCIKATEINEATAASISPFLRQTTKPLVPVITFWDLWKKSPDYKSIVDEPRARAQAKKLVAKFFPSLTESVDEMIFTSAKACLEAKDVPDEEKRYFTEDWNVDNVRRNLAHHVQAKAPILRAGKSKESALDTQRKAQVRGLVEKLCNESTRYLKNVREQIQNALPSGQHATVIQELKDEMQREVDHEAERIVSQLERLQTKKVRAIDSPKEWRAECEQVKNDSMQLYSDQMRQSSARLVNWFERFKQTKVDPCVKASGLNKDERQRIDEELKRFTDILRRPPEHLLANVQIFEMPNTALGTTYTLVQELSKGAVQLFLTNLPLALILIIAGPILSFVFPPLIPIVIIVFVFVFWNQFQRGLKLSLYQAREKTLEANGPDRLRIRVEEGFEKLIRDFEDKVTVCLDTRLSPLDSGTRNVLDNLNHDLDNLDEAARNIRQLI